ncbi:hypothetical protein [Deinococcus ruber]|uniref:Uncharacterized protein n=1 Tax=Deinococcus ruber TaxID=1848197 RepID=A0A918FCU5_9DEIO|nr:hypothetical protein [Deinococcus ruber]GGR31448.1 hypothetical protein GCM10008957_47700 [Deinococcus ruber]
MAEPVLSEEMQAFRKDFQEGLVAEAGFFFPYHFPGPPTFAASVWKPDVRGGKYAAVVAAVPDLAERDVRFMVVKPGDPAPEVGAAFDFDGGTLTVKHWGTPDPLSGGTILACSWEAG